MWSADHSLRNADIEDGPGFRSFIWIAKIDFEILLHKIGSRIQRKDTKIREVIPASNIRVLAVTLRYLASGDYFLTSAVMTSYLFATFLITVFVIRTTNIP